VDLDQYIIVPDFRFRHFAETYCALAFITIDDECPHGLSVVHPKIGSSATFSTRLSLSARMREVSPPASSAS